MSAKRHTDDLICPGCEQRLKGAHPRMAQWFHDIKARYTMVHVAWAYRDEDTQNRMFIEGKSQRPYPMSAHNQTEDGKPCARALDLFTLTEEGEAKWPPLFYAKLNSINVENREPIEWSGEWKKFRETCHFQLR